MRRLALALLISLAWLAPAFAAIIFPPDTGGSINGNITVRSGDTIGFSSSATDSTVACDTCLSRVSSTVMKTNVDFRTDGGLGVGAAPTGTAGDINIVVTGRIVLGGNSRSAGPLIATDDTTRGQFAGGTAGIRFLSSVLGDIADISNTGTLTLGATDNTQDIGTSALRVRTGYFGTSLVIGAAPGTALTGSLFISGVTNANLGTPTNGTVVFCSDCTIANPCAGSGTGALAKRLNGAWVCN